MKRLNKQFASVIFGLVLICSTAMAHEDTDSGNYNSGTNSGMNSGYNSGSKTNTDKTMSYVPHTTITFDSNSSLLTDNSKAALHSMLTSVRPGAVVSQIVIASWSDKDLPAQGHRLTSGDRDLAADRATAIADYLRESGNVLAGVKSYNMAENSNWIARVFRTSDAELKSTFSKKGAKTPVNNSEFAVIKDEGGPSSAVVLVQTSPSPGM